jgi:two-component system chemotaxis sensor kinase CheA
MGQVVSSETADRLIARFRSESGERLEVIEAAWESLVHGGGHEQARVVEHELHTLKGDARMVGFADVSLLCHKLEDLVECARKQHYQVAEDYALVMTMGLRFIHMLLRKKTGQALGGIDLEGFVEQVEGVIRDASERVALGVPVPIPTRAHVTDPRGATGAVHVDRVSAETRLRLATAATGVFLEQLNAEGASRVRLGESWRALAREITALDVAPARVRLLRHAASTEQLARDLGREATVRMDVQEVNAPTRALEILDEALLHLLRNAVDHGLESPSERRAAGKPSMGQIDVSLRFSEDEARLEVRDDGRGVDLEAVRARALALNIAVDNLDDAALVALLFAKGFSTRSTISDVSGRGVGLDAVKAAVEREHGRVDLVTFPERGSMFTVRLPVRSANLSVNRFKASTRNLFFCLPTSWQLTAVYPGMPREGDVEPLDLVGVRHGTLPDPGRRVSLVFQKALSRLVLCAGGAIHRSEVQRVCPTPDNQLVEVVRWQGAEGLLLHPEAFLEVGRAG